MIKCVNFLAAAFKVSDKNLDFSDSSVLHRVRIDLPHLSIYTKIQFSLPVNRGRCSHS